MNRFRLIGVLLAVGSLGGTAVCKGQVDASSATLKGSVLDPNGGPVTGATVSVTNASKGSSAKAQTAGDGTYFLPLLQPGAYDMSVEAQGFERVEIKGLALTVGQIQPYDVQLKIGSVKNVIDVTADPPVVQMEQPQQANTVNETLIQNLPNTSRNFAEAIFTLPGVSSSSAPRTQNSAGFTGFTSSGFSIGGSNGRNNLVTIDGGENEYGDGDLRTPNISQDSVQEFQVNRNSFAAEFGFTAGTAINVITRSGSNAFHGSAYMYFLDQRTEARNYFDRAVNKPYEQHIFPGGTFGGPILQNKLFFFTSYEYRRLNTPEFRDYLNTAETQGVNGNPAQLGYLQQLAASGNPFLGGLVAGLLPALTPLNNPSVVQLLTPNNGIFDDKVTSHDWVTRLDYQPQANDVFALRFSIERYKYTNIGASSLVAPSNASNTTRNDNAVLLTWNHVFTPALVNTARAQFVPSNTSQQLPLSPDSTQISVGSLGTFGQSYANPYSLDQQRYQFEDSVSLTKGKHSLKFGASYRPVDYNVTNKLWFGGEFDFFEGAIPLLSLVPAALQPSVVQYNLTHGLPAAGSPTTNLSALQAFSLGLPVVYRQGFGNASWNSWAHYLGLYAQDSWKASPRLTVDYGVRMDYDAEPSPVPHNTYVSPRLGIAWDASGDRKTVIRAGSGIFVSPVYFQVPYLVNLLNDSGTYINQVAKQLSPTDNTVPTLWGIGLKEGKLPFGQIGTPELGLLGITPRAGAPGRVVFNLAPNYKNNYSIQASLSVARQIMHNLSLELGYLMYRGVHLGLTQETNYRETGAFDPVYGPLYAPINPTIAQSDTYSSIGNSTYHGMTASLNRRLSGNLQFGINYTWSKAIDDVTDFNSQFASFFPTRLYLERGLSDFNIKHNFVANAVYTTPFSKGGSSWTRILSDLSVSPIVTARSGIPFSITVPGAANGTAGHSLYARPWYVARNTGIGPAFYSADLRISKGFALRGETGLRLEFSAEGTNLLNHTNFIGVNNVFSVGDPRLTSGPFNLTGNKNLQPNQPLGFTAASNPRQVQFGLRLAF